MEISPGERLLCYTFDMKSSDLFVKALENEGVKYVFGIPGEENLDMLESLRLANIEMVVTRHEQAAGFMAATVGRLTGRVGVCMSTLGPGATNFATSAAYAQLGGMPMMMVTGQKPIRKSKQGRFQIVDIVKMMEPLTKSAQQIVDGAEIPKLIRNAVKLAEAERPGAVHFELPEDVARDEVEGEIVNIINEEKTLNMASDESIAQAIEMIHASKKSLVLLGAGANRREDVSMACEYFVEKTGMCFVSSQMGKGAIDERHDRYLGTTALSANDFVHCATDFADLVIVVGHDLIEKPPFIMSEDGPKVIHINHYEAETDWVYEPQLQVVGDVADILQKIVQKLDSRKWDFSGFDKIKENFVKEMAVDAESDSFPMKPARIVADVRKVMPDDGIVCLDNGMYKLWFARHYKAYGRNTILLDNALATMGAGVPSAMAAKLVFPDKKVLAICGDGGFMMNSQELETALRMKLDLVVMILNDNGYQMIKWKQGNMGFDDYSLDFANPDFVKYAESYGAHGHRIENVYDLEKKLNECFESGGVHVIDVPIDYSTNTEISASTLKGKSCPI